MLLASDGEGRARDETRHIEDIASAVKKLRAFDADAKCHVLRVAPPENEQRFGTLTSAMTNCADCSARGDVGDADVCDKAFVRDCVSCGTCLTRTRNIVWSETGFGKTHLARAAFRRRVFGDDDDDDKSGGEENVVVAVPETTTDTPSARVGGFCGTDHAAAQGVLSAGSRLEIEAKIE